MLSIFFVLLLSCLFSNGSAQSDPASCNPDTEAPTCVVDSDIIIKEIDRGFGGDSVSWEEPMASDNCGEAKLDKRSAAPGKFFNTGFVTVTYTFSDLSNNTVTCRFNVCVTEGDPCTPPTTSIPTQPNSRANLVSRTMTTSRSAQLVITSYCIVLAAIFSLVVNVWLR